MPEAAQCRADPQLPAVQHGVPRVDAQVHQDLLELGPVGVHPLGPGPTLDGELDLTADQATQQLQPLCDGLVQIQKLRAEDLLPAEREQLSSQIGEPLCRLLYLREVLPRSDADSGIHPRVAGIAEENLELVVEVVRQTAGQAAHGLHLRRLPHRSCDSATAIRANTWAEMSRK